MTWFQGKELKVQIEKSSGIQQKGGAFNTNFEVIFPPGSSVGPYKIIICHLELLDTVISTESLMCCLPRMAGEGSINLPVNRKVLLHTPCNICGLGTQKS